MWIACCGDQAGHASPGAIYRAVRLVR